MEITHLDHLVLTVKSIDKTAEFYNSILGFQVQTFSGGRTALLFGNQKINLHEAGHEFEPKAHFPTPGSADLCFISHTDVSQVLQELHQNNITVLEGIVERTGAQGKIRSVYFRDPDLNLIEVSNYIK